LHKRLKPLSNDRSGWGQDPNRLLHRGVPLATRPQPDCALLEGALKTIVAFSNTAGGTLLIGVEDGSRHVRGVPDALDLEERLLRYSLSWLVYSEAFLALPESAREYVYGRIAEVLRGEDAGDRLAHLDAETRQTVTEILLDTHPELATVLRR
jgi:hypothetical protein